MRSKVKTVFVAFSAVGVFFASSAVLAMEANYSAADNRVTVTGSNSAEMVGVAIMPYKHTVETLNTDIINNSENILYFAVNAGGDYHAEIRLPDAMAEGKYRVSENVKKETSDSVIFIISEQDYNYINSASDESEFKRRFNSVILKIVPDMNDDVKNSLAESIYAGVKEKKYTYQTFIDDVAAYEGLWEYKYTSLEFGVYMDEYCAYVSDTALEAYGNLSEKELTCTDSIGRDLDFGKKSAEEIISEIILTARVRGASNYTDLRKIGESCFNAKNNTPSAYLLLSDYDKNNVFMQLFDSKDKVTGTADLYERVKSLSESKSALKNKTTGGGGGNGSSSARTPVSGAPVTVHERESSKRFNDISSHWARTEIESMSDLKILNGFDDGSFKPDNDVTRAEFVKMILTTFNYSISDNCDFLDVSEDAWYYGYISAAVKLGIINGVSETEFAPDRSLTRQDAAVILYRISKENLSDGQKTNYEDEDEMSDYALEATNVLSEAKILNGSDGYFRPTDNITRAEAAVMLLRVGNLMVWG